MSIYELRPTDDEGDEDAVMPDREFLDDFTPEELGAKDVTGSSPEEIEEKLSRQTSTAGNGRSAGSNRFWANTAKEIAASKRSRSLVGEINAGIEKDMKKLGLTRKPVQTPPKFVAERRARPKHGSSD